MTLLVTAIQNGLGEIDWSAATDNARWDHSTLVYEACDRASGGSDEERVLPHSDQSLKICAAVHRPRCNVTGDRTREIPAIPTDRQRAQS